MPLCTDTKPKSQPHPKSQPIRRCSPFPCISHFVAAKLIASFPFHHTAHRPNPSTEQNPRMLFRNRALAALLFVVGLASAHYTTNLRVDSSNKTAATSALDALSATMPNPVNTWKDEKTGTFYAQNQVFLTNKDPTRAVCDVEFTVPVDQVAQTKVESSYVSDVKTSKSGLDGGLPDYAEK